MRISSVRITGEAPDNIIDQSITREMFRIGIEDVTQWQSSSLYNEIILPLKNEVQNYTAEFNSAVQEYMSANSMLTKMKNSLNPSQKNKGDKITIPSKKINNNKGATNRLKATMLRGHDLLLKVRSVLTGQEIDTKFIISVGGRTYQISEKQIDPKLVLSKIDGGTVSNPFSLAYEIDLQMLKEAGLLTEENEITKTDVWQTIWSLKPEYLEQKKRDWAAKGIKREYPNIFFDSKDAEIYELYQQQTNAPPLDLAIYKNLRSSMGGGGGYASAFYKIGDIGSTQVKFFNLKEGVKSATVNFARFSLIRDRLRQLSNIFSSKSPQEMKNQLISFFTEEEEHISAAVSQEFNKEAKNAIEQLFKGFG